MIAQDRRARNRRGYRPEALTLEDRSLLSTTHLVKVGVVSGRVAGEILQPPILPAQDAIAQGAGVGVGRANAGTSFATAFLVHREDYLTGLSTINAGSAQLTSPRLGSAQVSFYGSEQLSGPEMNVGTIKLNGAVTSIAGGRFSRASTGTFSATANVIPATGQFLLSYKIALYRVVTHPHRV